MRLRRHFCLHSKPQDKAKGRSVLNTQGAFTFWRDYGAVSKSGLCAQRLPGARLRKEPVGLSERARLCWGNQPRPLKGGAGLRERISSFLGGKGHPQQMPGSLLKQYEGTELSSDTPPADVGPLQWYFLI